MSSTPPPRPWKSKGIQQLRLVLEAHRGDRAVLRELRDIMATRGQGRKRDQLRADIEVALAAAEASHGATPTRPVALVSSRAMAVSGADLGSEPELELELDSDEDQDEDEPADGFAAPSAPVRISPPGVQGKPVAWTPPPKEDACLKLGAQEPLPLRYAEAIEVVVKELEASNRADHRVEVSHGQRLEGSPEGVMYRFRCTTPDRLFEHAQVVVETASARCQGVIGALSGGVVHLAVQDDLGAVVPEATLRVDATGLLRKLAERMTELAQGRDQGFDLARATAICSPQPSLPGLVSPPSGSAGELNAWQARAVHVGLRESLLWLWGPPGTGKTKTLGALVRGLLDRGERILVCSNTNQAVDQVLLKLCRELGPTHPFVAQGRILRVGRIANEDLERGWSEFVTLEGVVARLGRTLRAEQVTLQGGRVEAQQRLEQAQRSIASFERYRRLGEEVERLNAQMAALGQQIEGFQAQRGKLVTDQGDLHRERVERQSAGFFAWLRLRSLSRIEADLGTVEQQLSANWEALQSAHDQQLHLGGRRDLALQAASEAHTQLPPERWEALRDRVAHLTGYLASVESRLTELAAELANLERRATQDARVLGATVTKAFLSPELFREIDTVVVDEASMVTLPALYNAVGLAQRGVVISGDFRQLSPIVETEQQAVLDLIGGSIFRASGIVDAVDKGGAVRGFVPLRDQYRMTEQICALVSQPYYGGMLHTARQAPGLTASPLPKVLRGQSVSIIDTSAIQPFARRPRGASRSNLMHALAVRNLLLAMRKAGTLTETETVELEGAHVVRSVGRVGVCTPYSAQSKLLQQVVEAHQLDEHVAVGTVHRFQGDEKDVIILETTDSVPAWAAGQFHQADRLELDGARLFNVAVTRARTHLVIVANLDFLEKKLPSRAYLRDVLHRAQQVGAVTPVDEVLALDGGALLGPAVGSPMPPGVQVPPRGFFKASEFRAALERDLHEAKKSVVVFSGFVTVKAVERLLPILLAKRAQGVRIRCVTRPPANNGSMGHDQGGAALRLLKDAGVAVDTRWGLHEKAVVVDEEVVWFGSLNVLSHAGGSSEMMARMQGKGLGRQVLEFLRPAFEIRCRGGGVATEAENPECPKCGGLVQLHLRDLRRRRPPFWKCHDHDGCGWTRDARWSL